MEAPVKTLWRRDLCCAEKHCEEFVLGFKIIGISLKEVGSLELKGLVRLNALNKLNFNLRLRFVSFLTRDIFIFYIFCTHGIQFLSILKLTLFDCPCTSPVLMEVS